MQKLVFVLALMVVFSFNGFSVAAAHDYYGSTITAEQAAQADAIAKSIADEVMSNSTYTTDLQKVRAAAEIVTAYGAKCRYGNDENKYYRSPYGVFISGNMTCAGMVRATGRVLDFMGYEYVHVNENEWSHQWITLYMDGKQGYIDPSVFPGGLAGYGKYYAGEETVKNTQSRGSNIVIPLSVSDIA